MFARRFAVPAVLAALSLAAPAFAAAPAVEPIAALHCAGAASKPGRALTVSGVITACYTTERSTRAYLQDATGAVCLYGAPRTCFGLGDSVVVTGTLAAFNGLMEVAGTAEAPFTATVLSRGARMPDAVALAPRALTAGADTTGCEPHESQLVTATHVHVRSAAGAPLAADAKFADDTNYRLVAASADSASNWIILRVVDSEGCDHAESLAGAPVPAGVVDVTGVLSQYARDGKGGYQLLARRPADIAPAK